VRIGRVLLWVAGILLLIAVATYVAGERTEVVSLRSVDEAGVSHETKLWVVDLDGTPWVRVARPQRNWFERIKEHPEVELVRQGVATPHRALEISDPETRARVDQAFREKYGLVDWWYGLLLRHDPRPVRLDPMVAGPREAMRPIE
jgi:hypothetical protein